MAVIGEIPDDLFAHQVNIDFHPIKHCRRPGWKLFTSGCPALATASPCLDWSVLLKMLLFQVADGSDIDHLKSDSRTLTAPPSNLPVVDLGLQSASKLYNNSYGLY